MFKQLLTLMLIVTLSCPLAYGRSASTTSKVGKEARMAEKIKEGIGKLGTGNDARVVVKLRDHTKLAGFISSIEEARFIITDVKTGNSTAVSYSDVTQVKGNNLSTGAKIAIGIGIGVCATLLVLYLISLSFD